MTTEIAQAKQLPVISTDRANRGVERLKHLLPQLQNCTESREEAEKIIPILSRASEPVKLMARIAALLVPYYEKDTPQAVREIEAEDWAVALGKYPDWAVENASRWWKSADNPIRHKRPLEGDIEARCKFEVSAIKAANIYLKAPAAKMEDQPKLDPVSEEDREHRKQVASDILKEFGFKG